MASELYSNLEKRHGELANKVWTRLGDMAEPCQNSEGDKFLKYSNGVVGIYERASKDDGLIHAVFSEEGELLSLMSGNNIVAKDGNQYLHVDNIQPAARKTDAEDSMVVSICDVAQQCSLAHAR
jgi:hypothetical protein